MSWINTGKCLECRSKSEKENAQYQTKTNILEHLRLSQPRVAFLNVTWVPGWVEQAVTTLVSGLLVSRSSSAAPASSQPLQEQLELGPIEPPLCEIPAWLKSCRSRITFGLLTSQPGLSVLPPCALKDQTSGLPQSNQPTFFKWTNPSLNCVTLWTDRTAWTNSSLPMQLDSPCGPASLTITCHYYSSSRVYMEQ